MSKRESDIIFYGSDNVLRLSEMTGGERLEFLRDSFLTLGDLSGLDSASGLRFVETVEELLEGFTENQLGYAGTMLNKAMRDWDASHSGERRDGPNPFSELVGRRFPGPGAA